MARLDALSIELTTSGKDKLKEEYGKVVENLQHITLASRLKNTDLSGDPTSGTVEAKRFANIVGQAYGTARTAGDAQNVKAAPVVISLNDDTEYLEAVENKDLKTYGVNGLIENLPMLLNAALQLIMGLAQGLITALPVLIAALPEIINGIVTFLLNSIPQIIQTGIELLTSLIAALPDIITTIVEAIPQIIDGLLNALLDSIPLIIQAGIDLLIALIQALPQIITTIVNAIPKIITGIVNALIGNIDKIIMAGVQLFVALIKNLPTIIVEIVKAVPQIVSALVNGFKNGIGSLAEVGKNLIQGLWNGINNAKDWVLDKIKGFGKSILNGIKSFFGIHSPSRVFRDEIGSNLALGIGEGFTDEMNNVSDMMEDAIPTDFNIGMNADVDSIGMNADSYSKDALVSAFQQALNGMSIKISEDVFGELVIDNVERAVYG